MSRQTNEKRKVNPSLEVAADARDIDLVTRISTDPAQKEVAVITPQPTGSQPSSGVQANNGQRPNDAGVAFVYPLNPPRIERGGTELPSEAAVGLEVTAGPSLPSQERVLVDQLEEEEADVAGEHVSGHHWFWEMLEEADYDVW